MTWMHDKTSGTHLKVEDTKKGVGLTKNYYITVSTQKTAIHKLILHS